MRCGTSAQNPCCRKGRWAGSRAGEVRRRRPEASSRAGERLDDGDPKRGKKNPCSRLHARNSERCAAAQRSRRSSAELREVAKYGPPSAGSGMLPLEGSGTYSARQRVVTRYGGARPLGAPSLASHVVPTSAARRPIALRREPKPYGGAAVQQTRLRERSMDRARREALAAGAADTFFVRFSIQRI